jgi:hypothetical protein
MGGGRGRRSFVGNKTATTTAATAAQDAAAACEDADKGMRLIPLSGYTVRPAVRAGLMGTSRYSL